MTTLQIVVLLVLGYLSLRGFRSAYVAFIVAVILYFPVSVDFHLNPRACELDVHLPTTRALLRNYEPILFAALFFLMSYAQVRPGTTLAFARAGVSTIAMAIAVELAEAVTGKACRLSDLVPVCAGLILGAGVMALWEFVRRLRSNT